MILPGHCNTKEQSCRVQKQSIYNLITFFSRIRLAAE